MSQSPATPAPVAAARRDARATGLRYVRADDPGIERRRAGKGFAYRQPGGEPVRDADTLARIRSLAIPPAWTDVWICTDPDGHLQATGRDARGRRQYRYHPKFRARRDRSKFARLVRFGDLLPKIRRRVRADLARPGLPREKVLAAVVALLETTRFRVGNEEYARLNRSFGISTLRTRHAKVQGSTIRFRFRGKGGRIEERALVDRRLAAVVRRCQDLPGQELFQYPGEDGTPRPISSEDVNAYIREAAGSDELSAKDFRTWTATVLAHRALRDALNGSAVDDTATRGLPKRIVAEALERTAEAIGDTVTVTRNSYVHPAVLEAPADPAAAPPGPAGQAARPTRRVPARAVMATRRDELAVLSILRSTARSAATVGATATATAAKSGKSAKSARSATGRSGSRTRDAAARLAAPARSSIAAGGSKRRQSSRRAP